MQFFFDMLLKNMLLCCIMRMCGDIDNIIGKGEEMRLRKRVHSAFIATVLTVRWRDSGACRT